MAKTDMTGIHGSDLCNCPMCRWADEVEKRLAAEKAAEEERLEVVNAS